MSFQPLHRRKVEFPVATTHEQFQLAAKCAAERMGGAIIERNIFTPRSAELVDSARRDQSSIYVGFMTPTAGPVLDSLTLRSDGSDSGIVNITGFYPYLAGAAIQEELEFPKPMTSVSERKAAPMTMTRKSRALFCGLSVLSPALANTYLLIDNPFAGDSPELTSILVPMCVDAGFFYFLMAEKGNKTTPGTVALGAAALFMRLSGLFGMSKEIDRYNTIVRSGYSLELEDIRQFKTKLTVNVIIQ